MRRPAGRQPLFAARQCAQWPCQLEDDRGGLTENGRCSPLFRPAGLGWIGRLARFDAIAAGDEIVVVPFVHRPPPSGAACRSDEAPVWLLFSDELDAVGEVGAEERV